MLGLDQERLRETPPPQLARDIRTKLAQLPGQTQERISSLFTLMQSVFLQKAPFAPSGKGAFALGSRAIWLMTTKSLIAMGQNGHIKPKIVQQTNTMRNKYCEQRLGTYNHLGWIRGFYRLK